MLVCAAVPGNVSYHLKVFPTDSPRIAAPPLQAPRDCAYHRGVRLRAPLMQRMEDSNFRQVARLTSLLTRMKRHERQMEAFEEVDEKCTRGL